MGRATAHLFADEGAHVAVADINEEGVQTVVDEIKAAGGSAAGWCFDVADLGEINAAVEGVARTFGGLDILINNAGFSHHMSVEDTAFEENWQRHMDVLLTAHVRLVRAALPYLKVAGGGRIVNIASTEGLGATPEIAPYTSAKHGGDRSDPVTGGGAAEIRHHGQLHLPRRHPYGHHLAYQG